MKRTFLLFLLFVFAFIPIASAQSDNKVTVSDQGMANSGGMMGSQMNGGSSKGLMMGPQQMMQMMGMMRTMMQQQKQMMQGMDAQQKAESVKKLDGMMQQMNGMMEQMKGMMTGMSGQSGAKAADQSSTESATTGSGTSEPVSREDSQGGVTVKVTLLEKTPALRFKIVLDTHSVDLDPYKFDEIAVLRSQGKELPASIQTIEGSGHHRSAVLQFEHAGTGKVELVIKNVSGVKERSFTFSLR